MTVIYRVVNTANGRVYIGKTAQTCQKRWKQHLYLARREEKAPFQNAIRKYGEDQFQIEPLCEVEDEEANFVEMLFIVATKSYPPNLGYGYNTHPGGEIAKLLPMDVTKYGRLAIVKMMPGAKCIVQCDCGSDQKTVAYDSLIRGKTKSCGCIRREMHYRDAVPFFGLRKIILSRYQRSKCGWHLTDALFDTLMQTGCYYCGQFQSSIQTAEWTDVVYAHSEICCKDSLKGFVPDNVLPCCKACFIIRKKMNHNDFMELLHKANNHQMSKKSMKAKM